MSNKKNFLFILLIILSLLNGCNDTNLINSTSNTSHSKIDKNSFKKRILDTSTRDIMPGTEKMKGIRYRIYNNKGVMDNQYNYNLAKGEVWEKFISITNTTDDAIEFKLLLFIDYKHSDYVVDYNSVEDYSFRVNPNQTAEIPVSINKLKEGMHDIIFIIVKNPQNKSLDPEFRSRTSLNNFLYFRFNITVNNEKTLKYNLSHFDEKDIKDNSSGIALYKSTDYSKQWITEDNYLKNFLNFYIRISNSHFNQTQKCALITLLDWKQVELKSNAVLLFQVGNGKEITIPCEIKLPGEVGIYDITSILVLNPYEKINKYNYEILSSTRVGVNVRSKN